MFKSIKLKDISELRPEIIRKSSSTRPSLWSIKYKGQQAVVKDFRANGFLFRNLIGRYLIMRESKAYKKLEGITGIPKFYGTIDGLGLIIEEIQGKNIESIGYKGKFPDNFLHDLYTLVQEFHKRGIVHCDLKRAPNIILGDDGKPYIVDWSASLFKRSFTIYPLSQIYKRFERDDLNAITKIKLKHCPEDVSLDEKKQYFYRGRLERTIRKIRDKAREILQKIA